MSRDPSTSSSEITERSAESSQRHVPRERRGVLVKGLGAGGSWTTRVVVLGDVRVDPGGVRSQFDDPGPKR